MTVYLTPTDDGDAIELSSTTFRKKILPKGKIIYGDREIVFDDEYLTDLAQSYTDGAYDQVPYMLADKSNAHTMDPERFRGECKSVEVQEDGLWGTFELSGDAAELVRNNPKLGVSARIVEGYERSDGKKYKRALQHVLGTLDPRIPGMGAWEEVDLSNEGSYNSSVIDLSNFDYEETEATVPANENQDTTAEVPVSDKAAFEAVRAMLPDWTDEQIQELLDEPFTEEELAQAQAELDLEAEKPEENATGEAKPEEAVTGEAKPAETVTAKTEEAPKAEKAETDEKVPVSLSNEVTGVPTDTKNVDLANQVAALQASAANEKFERERQAWVRDGVPPSLVDLARDILTAPQGAIIDLSNGVESRKVDAADAMRKLLSQCAGYIELAKDRGHTLSLSNESTDETAARDAKISAWRELDQSRNPNKR